MKRLLQHGILFGSLALLAFAGVSSAQEQTDTAAAIPVKPAEVRTNALQQLGLSREQMVEIRKINQARKPLMEKAQGRLHSANRALDESIYSDAVSDEVFKTRLQEFQSAQSEVARIRFVNELAVRRILNAEQVGRFRQIRERFDQSRQIRAAELPSGGKPRRLKLRRGAPGANR